jgi:hypothetical protein
MIQEQLPPRAAEPFIGVPIAYGGQTTSGGHVMKSGLAIIILGSAMMLGANSGAFAAGGQSYNNPNPDRQTYVNRSCCSWKTNTKQAKPVKH